MPRRARRKDRRGLVSGLRRAIVERAELQPAPPHAVPQPQVVDHRGIVLPGAMRWVESSLRSESQVSES